MVSFFMQDRIYAGEKMDALKMKYEEMKNDMVDLKNDAADIEKIKAIYQREHDAFIDHLAHNKNKDVIEHVIVYRECLKAFDALKRPNDKEALALLAEYAIDMACIASLHAHLLHLEIKEQNDE